MGDALAEHPGPGSLGDTEVHIWCGPRTASEDGLRRILGGYLGVSPRRVAFACAAGGKPSIEGGGGPAFNISHSGTRVVIAVSTRARVGIDIEQLRGRAREHLAERALAPEEAELLRTCPPVERERKFLRYWTAKEACLKALGIGLRADLKVLRIHDTRGRLSASGLGAEQLDLQRYDAAHGFVGTVAVSGGPWRARLFELAPEPSLSHPCFDSGA